ncbi:MAG: hypothetical protein ABR881_05985 [Candidatus Sulfotelmatobacter sp.]|jgi:hypothetical protein
MEQSRNQSKLEMDTAAYFENMTEDELKAERDLENAIVSAAEAIDFGTKE